MIRLIMGLSLACLFIGCGEPAADTTEKPAVEKEASNTAPSTDVAATTTEEPATEEVAATETKTEETSAPPKLITVKFKVPGMT